VVALFWQQFLRQTCRSKRDASDLHQRWLGGYGKVMITLNACLRLWLLSVATMTCAAQNWPLWNSYVAGFADNQVRIIDHDGGDRTTSEAQAYGMFFALVANDRSRFDGLLRWTEQNLAGGDLSAHLPAWLWGNGPNHRWGVRDSNPAADADVWMAYTLLEAGKAWNEPRYTSLGTALAKRIAVEETAQIAGFGTVLLPAPRGFQRGDSYRLNASYVPLQLVIRLAREFPDGPWSQIATQTPALITAAAPHGFAMDWIEVKTGGRFTPSPLGSYDAIRVYLWAGMLDSATPGRDVILKALSGMEHYLHGNAVPPAKVKPEGSIDDPKGPVGFSAALIPYVSALGDKDLENQQMSRVRSEFNSKTGLYGNPARYYDQNLAMFGLGWNQRQFWFDSQGNLKMNWKHN
jgi:endo-1,4-beta-D-glucanase Y